MNGSYIYVDTSAFMKLITPEVETAALQHYLQFRPLRVSCGLLRTEALRAAMRLSQEHVAMVRRQMRTVALVDLTRDLMEQAGTLLPAGLRSLDAIHLAAALSLGDELGDLITYDARMVAAAEAQGLSAVSPA
jgi:predicted nucleic acid-binding protein